jgi:RNA:NAD 2'-phosphotransferase (TPT1/KptA family)
MLPQKREDFDMRDLRELARVLARMLRHQVHNYNITIRSDGFVRSSDIIDRLRDLGSDLKYDEVVAAVKFGDKQRFHLLGKGGPRSPSHIRAISGHRVHGMDDTFLLGPPMNMGVTPRLLYHGTTLPVIDSIIRWV